MKPPVGSFPDALTGQEVVTKSQGDARYAPAGSIAAAQGDYLTKSMSASQAGIGANTVLAFDTVERKRGDLNGSGNQFIGLKAGRTYLLIANYRTTGGNFTVINWYDVTGAVYLTSEGSVGLDQTTISVHQIFSPSVDTTLEVRAQLTDAVETTDAYGANASVIEIGATAANTANGWELLETKEITGSAVSEFEFDYNIDGNADGAYKIDYFMVHGEPGTTRNMRIRVNDLVSSTNVAATSIQSGGARGTYSDLVLWDSLREYVQGSLVFRAEENPLGGAVAQPRSVQALQTLIDDPADLTGTFDQSIAMSWTDAGNLTRLVFQTTLDSSDTGTNAIGVGTVMRLYKRIDAPFRADSASLYERNVEAVVDQGTAADVTYTSGNATFGGSAVGVSVALVDDTVVSGSIDVLLKVDGVGVLTASLDATNTSYHRASSPIGGIAIAAGDALEVDVTTTSLVTTGGGSPAISVNSMFTADAFVQAPVGPDYAQITLSADQTTNINVGNHIEFDTLVGRGSSVSLATGAGQANGLITLQPGKTYEIHAAISGICNECFIQAQWRFDPSDTAVADDTAIPLPNFKLVDNLARDDVEFTSFNFIYTPTVEVTMKIDMVEEVGPFVSWLQGSRVIVKELK